MSGQVNSIQNGTTLMGTRVTRVEDDLVPIRNDIDELKTNKVYKGSFILSDFPEEERFLSLYFFLSCGSFLQMSTTPNFPSDFSGEIAGNSSCE